MMVRVGGIQVGTMTAQGEVVAKESVSRDYYLLTFADGTSRQFRYDQAVNVWEGK